ncbi:MAG: hypothetical protein G5Z42_02740 [Caldisphaeraceae archaeon]|nr:hypothetical protein [Caldisphaeraceae archaeon]MEB3797722.1 hypothetical protein [Caldisphaeraceae archaeon]
MQGMLKYLIESVYFIAIVVGFYIFGKLIGYVVKRILVIAGFNDWFRHITMGRIALRAGKTGGDFFGSIISYFLYATGVVLAIDYLSQAFRSIGRVAGLLTNGLGYAALFVFIILIGFILIDVFDSYLSTEARQRGGPEIDILIVYIKIVLYLTVITFALREIRLNVTPLMVLLQPLSWGLAILFVAVYVVRFLRR